MMNKVTMRVFNFDTQTYDYCVEMNTTRFKVANMSLEMWNRTKDIATSFPMTLSMMYDVCKEMLANENNTANLGWFSCEIEWNVGE